MWINYITKNEEKKLKISKSTKNKWNYMCKNFKKIGIIPEFLFFSF